LIAVQESVAGGVWLLGWGFMVFPKFVQLLGQLRSRWPVSCGFGLLFFAAITSSLGHGTGRSWRFLQDEFKFTREKRVLWHLGGHAAAAGAPLSPC